MDFKEINIGKLILERVKELDIPTERICKFFKLDEVKIKEMYNQESIPTDILLRWSKLLEYDFFRMYSYHLILYSPPSSSDFAGSKSNKGQLPQFRKNTYTQDIIDFILELIDTGEKTKLQVIKDYKIPKTTLYKWIIKKDQ